MPCKIYYFTLEDEQTKTEKLEWFKNTKIQDIDFQLIKPDKNANWINLADENNGFDDLIPLITKEKTEQQIFAFSSLGVSTNRDEWVYDFSKENLEKKIQFFIQQYNDFLDKNDNSWDTSIKWSEYLKGIFKRKQKLSFDKKLLISSNYRPFTNKFYYAETFLSDRLTQNHYDIFGNDLDKENKVICFSGISSSKNFQCLVVNQVFSLDFLEKTQCLPLYRYSNGERAGGSPVENITDWALALFQQTYSPLTPEGGLITSKTPPSGVGGLSSGITKLDIFHYVYAVLHKAEYRTTYEQNLKREFPRIPLYADFWKYAEAGKKLMELHLNYDTAHLPPTGGVSTPSPVGEGWGGATLLERKDIDLEVFKAGKAGKKKNSQNVETMHVSPPPEGEVFTPYPLGRAGVGLIYPILKIKDGNIEIDELTTLCGVPAEALAYKLGNRSAIEWILDQYKPYKSDDKTIQEQFNTYNFADYKEEVIELLQKVCFVSVETMKIVEEL